MGHPSVHVVELVAREANCRISHVFLGLENDKHPTETDAISEVVPRLRPGCSSTVSPLLRKCNFNIEVTKPLNIVGATKEETIIDCGLSYDSECPNSDCGHYNMVGLNAGAVPRRGIMLHRSASLSNLTIRNCMATWWREETMSLSTFSTVADPFGGGIVFLHAADGAVESVAHIRNVLIEKCAADRGGGIDLTLHLPKARFNFTNTSIVGSSAMHGSAVAISSAKTIEWHGGELKANIAEGNDGHSNWGGIFEVEHFENVQDPEVSLYDISFQRVCHKKGLEVPYMLNCQFILKAAHFDKVWRRLAGLIYSTRRCDLPRQSL